MPAERTIRPKGARRADPVHPVSPESRASRAIVHDKHGDLDIVIGLDKHRVSSSVLRNASKYFDRLLFGAFAEAQLRHPTDGSIWTIELEEDDPGAMDCLFEMMHLQFGNVKQRLTRPGDSEMLCKLVVAADKYDVVELLSPWAHRWLRDTMIFDLDPYRLTEQRWTRVNYEPPNNGVGRLVHAVLVAYEFGDEKKFVEAVRHMCIRAQMMMCSPALMYDSGSESPLDEEETQPEEPKALCLEWRPPFRPLDLSTVERLGPPGLLRKYIL